MTEEDKEDKQPTCAQVSHQEVWALFENIWSNVCQTRWAESRLDEYSQESRMIFNQMVLRAFFHLFIKCNSESSHAVLLRVELRKQREFSYMRPFTLWAKAWNAVYFDICFVFFPLHWPPEAFFPPCHVSAWTGSKRWALTLTLCRALNQREVLRLRRTRWSVCTNCPPWSRSCSRPSAGIVAPLASSPSFGRTLWHRAPLPAIIVGLLFVLKRPYALFAFQSGTANQFSLDPPGALFSFLTASLRTES